MNKKTWHLDEVVSDLEKLGVTCKDNNGNWKPIDSILQEIAKHWDSTKDLIKHYFNIKEEESCPKS